jgi:hypothetical protein
MPVARGFEAGVAVGFERHGADLPAREQAERHLIGAKSMLATPCSAGSGAAGSP